MSDKIFFSYSRYDSAFALKLANDLRNAGATIWLDQLDIPPGKHWDSEIEDALNNSNCLLAILSPKSMLSNNAMDEISYALEENKKVIPVLLTDTETPFRLRRLQRVDFTGDYDTAFRQLLKAIDIENPPAEKIASIQPGKTSVATPHPAEKSLTAESEPHLTDHHQKDHDQKDHDQSGQHQEDKHKKEQHQKDLDLWAKTRSANTLAAYEDYLKTTSSDDHKDEAAFYSHKLRTASVVSPEATTAQKTNPGTRKKTLLITVGLSVLAAIAFAAFLITNNDKDPKDTMNVSSQAMQTAAGTQDSFAKESGDTLTKTANQASATLITVKEPVIRTTDPEEPVPASKEINKRPEAKEKKTEPRQQPADTVQRITKRDSSPIVANIDQLKVDGEPKPTPTSTSTSPTAGPETSVMLSSNVMVELKLLTQPELDVGRDVQPVTYAVTKDVVVDGTTIIKQGAIANGTIIVGLRFMGIKIEQVRGTNGKMIPVKSKESDLKKREVKKDNIYYAIIKKGTRI
ncbi:toll/interleukin-1 receptor domain-containing protein [Flavitalea antarctica]